MKLEALNGNLMSLTMKAQPDEEQIEEKEALIMGEGMEGDGEEPIEEGEKEVGGKKKGARKKRSLNWEEAERGLLVEVIKPKVDYVENRNVDAKSIKAKRMAWMHITKQFNALNFRHRSLEQIQVQWRSMKNSAKREYQQKHPKSGTLEGIEMLEFMEELQKDPVSARSQTRGAAHNAHKKELMEMDDEDTPLAALPTSTSNSDDTMQTSRIALPSPPPSADSQHEGHVATPTRNKKKLTQTSVQKLPIVLGVGPGLGKPKRQRSQNSSHGDSTASTIATELLQQQQLPLTTLTTSSPSPPADDKYKRQLFELMKRSRLADMEYARIEHEQRIRLEQEEQAFKLNIQRQYEELKLRQLREEHELRMLHYQSEHEARMLAYRVKIKRESPKIENEHSPALSLGHSHDMATANCK